MGTKVSREEYREGFEEKNHETRINLNDLLKRAKEEKNKTKKINMLVFSGVLFSALLVIVIISYL